MKVSYLTAGHLVLEHLDHVVEGASAADLRQHVVELALVHELQGGKIQNQHILHLKNIYVKQQYLSDVVEGGPEIALVDGAILVDVHELEALLVHVQLLLGEAAILAPGKRFGW